MRTVNREEIEAKIISLVITYSGRKVAALDDFVSATLGIDREDAVEFFSEIERTYRVDLRPITEVANPTKRRRFWSSGRQAVARDPRLSEIIDFIYRGEGGGRRI